MIGLTVPCRRCRTSGHYGSRHSCTIIAEHRKAILRCLDCGSGWRVDISHIPLDAPIEITLQMIGNLVSNNIADFLEPQLRDPDEESVDRKQD